MKSRNLSLYYEEFTDRPTNYNNLISEMAKKQNDITSYLIMTIYPWLSIEEKLGLLAGRLLSRNTRAQ